MNSCAVTDLDVIFVAIMKSPDDLSLAPQRPAGVVVWHKTRCQGGSPCTECSLKGNLRIFDGPDIPDTEPALPDPDEELLEYGGENDPVNTSPRIMPQLTVTYILTSRIFIQTGQFCIDTLAASGGVDDWTLGQWEPGGTTKCSELAFQDWTGHFTTAGKLPRGTGST
jgi:hypothetical protein